MSFTFSRARRAATVAGTLVASGALVAGTTPTAAAQPIASISSPALASATSLGIFRPIPFTAASADLAGSGQVRVAWQAPGAHHVDVFAGTDAHDAHRLVGTGRANGELTVPASAGTWFRLVPDSGQPLLITVRDRGLSTDPNLRDVGGYRAADGRWVRMGAVYRSQALTLSPADLATVDSLGVTRDYDLRTPAESQAAPDVIPTGATYTMLNVMGTTQVAIPALTSAAQAQQYMADIERQFVTSPAARQAFGTLLTSIAEGHGVQLFHCTAGKDRTGWATAVLLTLLGVPGDAVMRDYLLSNDYYYNSPAIQAQLAAMPPAQADIYRHVLDVEPDYLLAGFDQVTASYGSMLDYATKGLGLSQQTLSKLRQRLLVG